ncbi:MAG: hypothetical protein WBO04_05255 [Steroidobacteraceae bacterium]
MKTTTVLASLAAATFVFASAATAQGQQGGQQGGQQRGQQAGQQQRQADRAMSQDRVMDQERMQARDRDRTKDQEQVQSREHASAGKGEGIYGGNLMTVQERNQYREQFGGLKTDQERNEFKAQHQEQMQLRAKERGVEPEVTTD